ncbi:MAG: heavy metal translocating P-type ATPase [Lachnospiraceae bacterium]|nr:heavy metal translocating P-type ATPase [Lachnospiraceae bacterium]
MKQYSVTGMSCAACVSRVEKAVSKVPGVESCSVSLLTNSMGIEGDADPSAVIEAVTAAGYGAAEKGSSNSGASSESGGNVNALPDTDSLKDTETPRLKKRLLWSLGFLLVLMYFSMGHHMWGFPVPAFFHNTPVAIGLLQLILAAIVMVINQRFFISGFTSLLHGSPNMDTLVALGSGASFLYSTVMLFAMAGAQTRGDSEAVAACMNEFYFESAAMILTLITIGKMLEARSKGRTTDALKSLMNLSPKTAVLIRDGLETEVPISEVKKGDIFAVRPGESIPVDGVILSGSSAINEAALTGESIPVDKAEGDPVSAATINQSGYLRCEATRVGEDTTLSQIIRMVSDAAATKAPIAKIADKVSGIFVPSVMVIAAAAFLIWLLTGHTVGYALARGISVLVISCPCALGLATPVAIMVGNGMGAKNGLLFKTAASLEETGRIRIVVLDKTGTITAGEPVVTDLLPCEGISEQELLSLAATLEQHSEHPLAKAVMKKAENLGILPGELTDFQVLPGNGLRGNHNQTLLLGGNFSMIRKEAHIPEEIRTLTEKLSTEGKTPLFFAADHRLLGIIAVADVIKPDSPRAVQELKNMGIRVIMLTGDNQRTADAIGAQVGVDQVVAGVLPEGKEAVVRELKKVGKTAMVGDGINDAPALTAADMGIAIGAGTDVAIDAADVVLMNSRLTDVSAAVRLSRGTLKNIKENLFWAFFYNVIGIPLAAGLWIPILGLQLSPMFGAAAMSLSSFCVVSNALRLNLLKVHSTEKDRIPKDAVPLSALPDFSNKKEEESLGFNEMDYKEETTMTKTVKIEGMACGHCTATVKKALEALEGVSSAEVSLNNKQAVVTLTAEVSDDVLKKTVEDKDFTVTGIE